MKVGLGHDTAKISGPETFQINKEILDAETGELSQYKLVADMIRETGIADTRFDETLVKLMKLRQEFVDTGEKTQIIKDEINSADGRNAFDLPR